MKDDYDFSKMKELKNYTDRLDKKGVGIRLNHEAIDYFKQMSIEKGIGYQQLINLYLLDCAKNKRKINFDV